MLDGTQEICDETNQSVLRYIIHNDVGEISHMLTFKRNFRKWVLLCHCRIRFRIFVILIELIAF